ncbi:MAG: F0F1 ATP synthase subunit A [Fibrobacter sp.]|nr:F0F1 ATP synthase subunit A [Fibrobacter sp.]
MFLLLIICLKAYGDHTETKEDLGAVLMHHVADKNEWSILPAVKPIPIHNLTIGPVTIPFTLHVLMLIICFLTLAISLPLAFKKKGLIPNKLGIAIEPITMFIREGLVYPSMGEELGRKWLPFFYTLFFFLLTSNLMGLIPIFGTSTGNLSVTGALAIMIFVGVVGQGMLKNGFFGFFKNMIPSGIPWPIGIILLVIEIPGLIIRNSVLAIRLFANMIAGHFVILSLLLLIFVIHPLVSIVSVPLALFINLLEVLVAIIQAIVFTMLSAIFISMATNHH